MTMRVLVFVPGKITKVGLWQPDQETAWKEVTIAAVGGAGNRMLQGLDQLLQSEHITLALITHIGVLAGPASYTELRLGVATAQTLAWSLRIPLFAFGSQDSVPGDLPRLVQTARTDQLIEPLYPHQL